MRLVLALLGVPLAMVAAVVEGTVVDDRSGSPLAEARVEVAGSMSRGVRTDERGGFRIEDLVPGVYSIYADKAGFREVRGRRQGRGRVEVTSGGARVDFRMLPLARLTGTVWLAADHPARGASVRLSRVGHQVGEVRATDSEGRFDIHYVDPGIYHLSARLGTGAPPPRRWTIASSAGCVRITRPLSIRMGPPASMYGPARI